MELVQPESAIDDATEAIRLNPGHAKASSVRGMAQIERFVYEVSGVPLGDLLTATHSARGELESALQDFDRAIQLDPKLADAFFGRGLVQLALENFSAAMSDIDEALSMESRLSEDLVAIGYFLRAGLHAFEEQFQKAIEDMDRAIGLEPNVLRFYMMKARAHSELSQYEQAIQSYGEMIRLQPDNPGVYVLLSLAYKKLGMLEEAQRHCERAEQLGGQDFGC